MPAAAGSSSTSPAFQEPALGTCRRTWGGPSISQRRFRDIARRVEPTPSPRRKSGPGAAEPGAGRCARPGAVSPVVDASVTSILGLRRKRRPDPTARRPDAARSGPSTGRRSPVVTARRATVGRMLGRVGRRRRQGRHRELPAHRPGGCARSRLYPPHPAAHGPGQPRPVARLPAPRAQRVVRDGVRRRVRVGDAARRRRHEPARRRRDDGLGAPPRRPARRHHRTARAVASMRRLDDLGALLEQESAREKF